MSSSNSLLWLKYAGIPSYEDIYSKKDFYAFKCKKYAYWKDVHSSKNSKDLLLECFESLKSDEDLTLEQFEEIQQSWEKVQRWKKDKEKLSIEPDKAKLFIKLESQCQAGSVNSNFLLPYIKEFNFTPPNNEEEVDVIWLSFLAKVLDNFLSEVNIVPLNALEVDPREYNSYIDFVDYKVSAIYDYLGYSLGDYESGAAILTILSDLEIDSDKKWIEVDVTKEIKTENSPSILFQEDDASQFILFRTSMDNMSIVINPKHPLFSSNELLSNTQVRLFIEVLGQAAKDNIGDIDKIQDFINNVGSRLRLALKSKKKNAQR